MISSLNPGAMLPVAPFATCRLRGEGGVVGEGSMSLMSLEGTTNQIYKNSEFYFFYLQI